MWIPKGKPRPTWRDLTVASVIIEPGNSAEYLTGDWRVSRPVIDQTLCNRCGLCWIYCPDASIIIAEDDSYQVDLDHCKGCGICVRECKKGAMKTVEEGE